MRKIPLSCNLRFNVKNERHMKAAELLSMVGARYKTAFVALAVEAYINTHPSGIDMNELQEIQKDTWRKENTKAKDIKPKITDSLLYVREPDPPAISAGEPEESREAAKSALNYYKI